jgi:hypothetical protein
MPSSYFDKQVHHGKNDIQGNYGNHDNQGKDDTMVTKVISALSKVIMASI